MGAPPYAELGALCEFDSHFRLFIIYFIFLVAVLSSARGGLKMKRFILLASRCNKDEKTNDELMFLTLGKLPSKMSNGGLWYAKKGEEISTACINKTRDVETYNEFLKVLPGSLVDCVIGINEFNNKAYIASIKLVEGTNVFTEDLLYI